MRTPLPGTLDAIARGARALDRKARPSGLRGKLWVAFVLQVIVISLATLFGVYGAEVVLRDVLIQRALVQETQHFWQRMQADPQASLPDTYNMRGLFRRGGAAGATDAVPSELAGLDPGYHRAHDPNGHDELVYVSDGPQGRLWLVFAQEQVNRLAFWFGLVPLTFVLLGIYLASWFTYRRARRAVSPMIWLAKQVRTMDPKHPQLDLLAPDNLPPDSDPDVRFLAGSIHGFARRLEEAVARERNFTRDASHELRSPLTVIKVAADVMLADSALEPFEERSLNRIKRATKDMEALIEAFLILAREDDVGLPDEDFVANEAVAIELERANDLVKGKPVQIRQVVQAQFALHAPLRVFGVMVGNLLRNACTYTEQGTVTVTIGRDFVSVADTGPGMAPDELKQLFKPYFRGRQSGSGGHGIGLTIVKRLSDRFDWPLELESRLGVGTTATIRFPNPQPV